MSSENLSKSLTEIIYLWPRQVIMRLLQVLKKVELFSLFVISLCFTLSHPYFSDFEGIDLSLFFQIGGLASLFVLTGRLPLVRASVYWALPYFVSYAVFLRWMGQSPYLAPWGVVGQYLAAFILSLGAGFWYYFCRKYLDWTCFKRRIAACLLWGLMEWSRQFWFCGFPWYTLSFAWVNWRLGTELLGLLGPFWMSSLVLSFSFALSQVCSKRKGQDLLWHFCFCVFLVGSSLLTTQRYQVPIQVATLHTDMPLHYFPGCRTRLDVWGSLLQESPSWKQGPWNKPRFCLTHEGLLPDGLGFYGESLANPALASKLARLWNCYLIVGLEDDGFDLGVANAIGIWKPSGELKGFYHKQILVPFAEYFPMMGWPLIGPWFVSLAKSYGILEPLQPGLISGLYELEGIPILFSICFEETFPSLIAKESRRGARLWMSSSNDGWFPNSSLAFDHYLHARLVGASTGLALVRSTQKGYSAILNGYAQPMGGVLGPEDSWQWKVEDSLEGRKTLYGSIPEVLGLLSACFWIVFSCRGSWIWSLRRKAGQG